MFLKACPQARTSLPKPSRKKRDAQLPLPPAKRSHHEQPPTTFTQFLLRIVQVAEQLDSREREAWPEVTPQNVHLMLQLAAEKCSVHMKEDASRAAAPHNPPECYDYGSPASLNSNVSSLCAEVPAQFESPPPAPKACPPVCIGPAPLPPPPGGCWNKFQKRPNDDLPIQPAAPPHEAPLYAAAILINLTATEASFAPDPMYLTTVQTAVSDRMRAVLVDWIFEVCDQFHLSPMTFPLTVSLVDRYLSVTDVSRQGLQLVGVAACLIAAKLQEQQPPRASDFLYVCAGAYTAQQLFAQERSILDTVGFRCLAPTPLAFLGASLVDSPVPAQVTACATFLAQATLVHAGMMLHTPSAVADSCLHLCSRMHRIALPVRLPPNEKCIAALRLAVAHLAAWKLEAISAHFDTPAYHQATSFVQRNVQDVVLLRPREEDPP